MTISRSNIPKQITTGGRKMMKKKGYRMGGKIKSKCMKKGGKVKKKSKTKSQKMVRVWKIKDTSKASSPTKVLKHKF